METLATATRIFRTPDDRFEELPGFPYEPRYVEFDGIRVAFVDEGAGQPVLMLHGFPTWSFLFRKLIPPIVDAGYRCIAIDYVGFGRSDKPTDLDWYTYERHAEVCRRVIEALDLRDIVLLGHDWGGPIGLLLATRLPELFDRHVLIDTPFFTGRQTMPDVWWQLHDFVEREQDMPIERFVEMGCKHPLTAAELGGYLAPFPSAESKAGARAFPLRVLPLSPDLPAAKAGWRLLKTMRRDERPTLILWGAEDLIFPVELGQWVAGALRRDPPVVVPDASHFVPEDQGEQVGATIVDWLGRTAV